MHWIQTGEAGEWMNIQNALIYFSFVIFVEGLRLGALVGDKFGGELSTTNTVFLG